MLVMISSCLLHWPRDSANVSGIITNQTIAYWCILELDTCWSQHTLHISMLHIRHYYVSVVHSALIYRRRWIDRMTYTSSSTYMGNDMISPQSPSDRFEFVILFMNGRYYPANMHMLAQRWILLWVISTFGQRWTNY